MFGVANEWPGKTMDESKVLFLIAEGEGTTIEFKRELDLSSAKGKAEFIKDIISLANSARDVSYMLIGVDNNKLIVGITDLDEEQIQHVAQTSVDPPINLDCRIVPVNQPALTMVGVIVITPTTKPHKTIRSIEDVTQRKVFIRRGSVVLEASPEEIIALSNETQLSSEARQYIRAAETHLKLGDVKQAIAGYSKAIESFPSYDLFLTRGKLYERLLIKMHTYVVGGRDWADLAYKDFSNALKLANSKASEKQARLGRFRVASGATDGDEFWEEDLDWLKRNTQGRELGEILYLEIDTYDGNVGYVGDEPIESLKTLNEILRLGYEDPHVYELRSEAHFRNCNYGLALEDIDRAISMIGEQNKATAECLVMRATILARMGKYRPLDSDKIFERAFDDLEQARRITHDELPDHLGYLTSNFAREIVHRYALEYEFADRRENEFRRALLQTIIVRLGGFNPKLTRAIHKIVGEDFLRARGLIK